MAYNNGFYQNYYPQPVQQPMQGNSFQNGTSSIIWVQGEAGAKSYLVAPNTTVQLWDSEEQVIYLKSADASGMPTMKVLDYTIRDNQQSASVELEDSHDYVTRNELTEIEKQINELKKQLEKRSRNEQVIRNDEKSKYKSND